MNFADKLSNDMLQIIIDNASIFQVTDTKDGDEVYTLYTIADGDSWISSDSTAQCYCSQFSFIEVKGKDLYSGETVYRYNIGVDIDGTVKGFIPMMILDLNLKSSIFCGIE